MVLVDVGAIVPIHTGFWWFDAIVYVVSGAAFLRLCWLVPRFIRDQIRFWFGDE